MAAQISADFEQMLENIHTLVKSIEGAGVGTRSTEMDGLRTNTTATYLDSASAYAAGLESMIAELAVNTAAFRDALRAVVDQKQESEASLSSTLSQIAQVVEDPSLTSAEQLANAGASSNASEPPVTTTATATGDGGSESGEF